MSRTAFGRGFVAGIRLDLKGALRQLRLHPLFAFAAILTLALAIGLNAAVFSLINALLLRPLPVAAPEELIAVYSSEPGDFMARSPLAAVDVQHLSEQSRALRGLSAYTYAPLAVEHDGASRLVLGARASRDFFDILGVSAAIGNTFSTAGGDEHEPDEVVISNNAWRRHFGADPAVIGSALRIGGRPATIVGVAPERFFGLTRGFAPELWLPLPSGPETFDHQSRMRRSLWVVGRLAPEAELKTVQAELSALGAQLANAFPDSHRERELVALPADSVRILPGVDATLKQGSVAVLALVALVLLIASANVAQLLLARALDRRREIGIRLALGANPALIVRLLLVESLLLALLGGGAGLLLASAAQAVLGALPNSLPVDLHLDVVLDSRVLIFTTGISLLGVLIFGLAPAISASRAQLSAQFAGRGDRQGLRLGAALVVAQVALTLPLLMAAGLMVRSLGNAHDVDLGFDPHGVAVATFAPSLPPEQQKVFNQQLLDRARALPEVQFAGFASHLPLTVEIRFQRVASATSDQPQESWPNIDSALVGPGYFEALKIPRLRGRLFQSTDDAEAPPVVVVNRSFAERFWPGEDALGRRLQFAGESRLRQVVGIVSDGKYRTLGEAPRPFLYRPLSQTDRLASNSGEITTGSKTLVVRTRGEPRSVLPELRRQLLELDPAIAIARLEGLEETLDWVLLLPRTGSYAFGLFGVLGLTLSALGLAGVLVYTVRRRQREIGIRMALGARPSQIGGLVLRDGITLTLVGAALGWAAAGALTQLLSAALYGIAATDMPTWLVGTAVLISVALLASYLPARAASRIDPIVAIRRH